MLRFSPLLSCVLLNFLCYFPATQEELVTGIGINLCNQKCVERGSCTSFAYVNDRLACHLLHNDSVNRTMKEGYVVYPKQRSQLSACFIANCGFNTRCVERRRGGAACVKVPTLCNPEHDTGDTEGSTPESRCITDTDCLTNRMFVCFTKTCKCTPGYSFNSANNSCIRRCIVYGNGLTTYQGLGITEHNDRSYIMNTETECSNMCIREDGFTCRTFEYNFESGTCLISKTGYLDVDDSKRETGDQGWILAVRNCE